VKSEIFGYADGDIYSNPKHEIRNPKQKPNDPNLNDQNKTLEIQVQALCLNRNSE